jgi:hypothetical protein
MWTNITNCQALLTNHRKTLIIVDCATNALVEIHIKGSNDLEHLALARPFKPPSQQQKWFTT